METAASINDEGVVAGVRAGTRGDGTPGKLATWYAGAVTDVGEPSVFFLGTPQWVIRSFDSAGRILADVRTDLDLLRSYETFLFEPGRGVRPLIDASHALGVSGDKFGTWSMRFGDQAAPGFALGMDGRILAYAGVLSQVDDQEPWVLRADSPTASLSASEGQYFAGVNQFGELVLFRETAQGWEHERLSLRLVAGGDADLVMFTNPRGSGGSFLVMADSGRMDIYSLTGGTSGGNDIHSGNRPPVDTPIADKLTTFTNLEGVVHLVGVDQSGDLVIYFLTNPDAGAAPGAWAFDNLSRTHLAARGQETPEFASNLTAFMTPWGTMHIAGLDADGHAQIVWWAPDSPLWRLNDLTAAAGDTRDMTGNISAFVTSWSTLHINGVDEEGRVVALWWAPGFDLWRVDQLAPSDSTTLAPESVTSYVTPWGGLNVVGRDAVTSRATSYWWSPESNVWSWWCCTRRTTTRFCRWEVRLRRAPRRT